jgi:hypothetical protein
MAYVDGVITWCSGEDLGSISAGWVLSGAGKTGGCAGAAWVLSDTGAVSRSNATAGAGWSCRCGVKEW